MADIVALGVDKELSADRYGWKASRLNELLLGGVQAVGGFSVSADEHLRHLDRAGLDTTATRRQVRRSALDESLKQALLAAAENSAELLAVRSSALEEDSPSASRAGQYLSLLNVERHNVPAAVLDVWASAHSEVGSVPVHFSPMAVLIQPMLLGDAFGVVSSSNPVTGSGVAVVEVGVTPTSVTSGEGQVIRYQVYPDLTLDPLPGESSQISAAALRSVARTAWEIRDQHSQNFELEFGCQRDEVFILQARPLTTVPPRSTPPSVLPKGNWVLDPVHYPRPLTPLFESIFAPVVSKVSSDVFAEYGVLARSIELKTIGGWPYVQATPLSDFATPALPGVVIGLIARIHPEIRQRTRASAMALSSGLSSRHVAQWQEVVRPASLAFVENVSGADLRGNSSSTLAQYIVSALQQLESVIYSNFQTDFAYLIPLAEFTTYMRKKHGWGDSQSLALVQSHGDSTKSYAMALEDLASRLSTHPDVVARLRVGAGRSIAWIAGNEGDARQAWEAHLRRWGLTLLGYDLDEPTVRELPEVEKNALIAILDGARGQRVGDTNALLSDLTPDEKELLTRAEKWYYLREEGESVKATVLGALRAVAMELGCRLESSGHLPQADTVLCLTVGELLAACSDAATVEPQTVLARVRARKEAMALIPDPELGKPAVRNPDLRWLPSSSRQVHNAVTLLARNEILASVTDKPDRLCGRPVSAGIHSGKVRVITDPGQLRDLHRGDVIVASSASSTWGSAFLIAGALITEAGGLLSHSAIVAREMGLPAIVGVRAATARLADGDWITVDGNNGTIMRHNAFAR